MNVVAYIGGRRWSRLLVRYGLAVALVALATHLRLWLMDAYGPMPLFVTLYPAILIAASVGGGGPGILATLLSAVAADYYYIEPGGLFTFGPVNDQIALGIFTGSMLFVCVLAERLRRSRWKEAVAGTRDQERQWLRTTLSSIGDAVLAVDTDGNVTFLNPVAESLTGWPEKEALGRPARDVFRIIHEKTREPGDDIIGLVLSEGKVRALANHTAIVTRDGRETPIEDSAAPIKDDA